MFWQIQEHTKHWLFFLLVWEFYIISNDPTYEHLRWLTIFGHAFPWPVSRLPMARLTHSLVPSHRFLRPVSRLSSSHHTPSLGPSHAFHPPITLLPSVVSRIPSSHHTPSLRPSYGFPQRRCRAELGLVQQGSGTSSIIDPRLFARIAQIDPRTAAGP